MIEALIFVPKLHKAALILTKCLHFFQEVAAWKSIPLAWIKKHKQPSSSIDQDNVIESTEI